MRKFFAAILIFGCSLPLSAQLSVGVKQGFGAHGISIENKNGEKINANHAPLWVPNTGVVLSFNNKMNAGLQMEINYTPKGWREEIDSLDNTFYERRINYLEIPLFSHFEIGKKELRIIIMGGPYFAFKLNEVSDSNNYASFKNNNLYNEYYLDTKTVDFGIKAAIGLRYNINPKLAIFSELRYDIDMAGGRDIFIDRPNGLQTSRLTEVGGVFGILWHIIPQEKKNEIKGYTPKENLYYFND